MFVEQGNVVIERWRWLCGGLVAGLAWASVCAADPMPTPSARTGPTTSVPTSDSRHAFLLLPTGPVHVGMRITIDGKSLAEARRAYVNRLFQRLDADRDGKLSRAEARKSPLITSRRTSRDSEFLNTLDGERSVTKTDLAKSVDRVGGETVAYRQDNSSVESDLEVFKLLDLDGSGMLERDELAAAPRLVGRKDVDRDETVTFEEFVPPRPADPNLIVMQGDQADAPQERFSELLRDSREPLLPARMMRMYDLNRDGKLAPAEFGRPADQMGDLDRDGNRFVDARELARIAETAPDIEFLVDLGENGFLQVTRPDAVAMTAARADEIARTGLVRINIRGVVLTISLRRIDPVVQALDNARQEFNRLDVDMNGYLDRTEVAERPRFERYLFDPIDLDGDGKLFGEELRAYVVSRTEPVALSCQVNLYDVGNGFFQMLDGNGDGRVSIRELRGMEKSLVGLLKGDRNAVRPDDTGRHYRLELVRGSFQLFGRSERMVSQSNGFLRPPSSGPIWFQRMDRNGDGDLTWKEFLGPREVFHQLDADHDGLIDPVEALKAGANTK